MAAKKIAGLSLAVAAGVGTVAVGGNALVQKYERGEKFSLDGDRFDLTTFRGRFLHMLNQTDPSMLIHREAAIRESENKLKQFAAGTSTLTDTELWNCRIMVESAIHPDTNETVPEPFRMSGYVPFNGPICVAMIMSSSTPVMLFWNWVNQSQNALVNYFNRNAASNMSNETMAMSYAGAVGSALTIAFGLSTAVKANFAPARAAQLLTFVAFPTSVAASSANCYIIRRPEIETGLPVLGKDKNGAWNEVLADGFKSNIAAAKAVYATTASRAFLQFPVFFVPPLLMSVLPAMGAAALPVSTYVTILCFGFGLPGALACFPIKLEVDVKDLEPELQEKLKSVLDENGQPVTTVKVYKGL